MKYIYIYIYIYIYVRNNIYIYIYIYIIYKNNYNILSSIQIGGIRTFWLKKLDKKNSGNS